VDLVLMPAVTGDFGVMPGHVPTVAQLRPGVVTVHKELDKEVTKYFVRWGGGLWRKKGGLGLWMRGDWGGVGGGY
jgi:F0F1-type ATP synthase epsilon subunit